MIIMIVNNDNNNNNSNNNTDIKIMIILMPILYVNHMSKVRPIYITHNKNYHNDIIKNNMI